MWGTPVIRPMVMSLRISVCLVSGSISSCCVAMFPADRLNCSSLDGHPVSFSLRYMALSLEYLADSKMQWSGPILVENNDSSLHCFLSFLFSMADLKAM